MHPALWLGTFLLLLACAGLWHLARAVRKNRKAPRWAGLLDERRGLVMLLLGAAVISLVALGGVAIVALVLEGG